MRVAMFIQLFTLVFCDMYIWTVIVGGAGNKIIFLAFHFRNRKPTLCGIRATKCGRKLKKTRNHRVVTVALLYFHVKQGILIRNSPVVLLLLLHLVFD